MATFLLTWNPKAWPESDYAAAVAATAAGRPVRRRWGVGQRRSGITAGDRAFLARVVRDRGVVATGRFTSESYPAEAPLLSVVRPARPQGRIAST